jgi:MFS family permease
MSLLGFCDWLANTQWSVALHESTWAYSIIESVHVLTLCLFLGMAVMLDLRLLGLMMRRTPVSEVVRQLVPWMVTGFAVMVISGSLLFYAIPVRTYQSIFFRAKVLMLVLAGLNVWIFHSTTYRKVKEWERDRVLPRRARLAAGLSLALWAGIVIAGRMIAYNWFDCDRQPQPAIVNWAAGCVTDSR